MLGFLTNLYNFFMQNTTATLRMVLIALVIFLPFYILSKWFTQGLFDLIYKISARTESELDDKLILAFKKPTRYLFLLVGLYLALIYLPLSPDIDVFISKVFRSGIVLLVAWGIYDLAGNNSFLSLEMKERLNIDDMLVPFFSKTFRFIIIALALVLIANEWHYNVNGFIAGLGLGGLAFALAAKDALANIFGGIVIIMEKPFSIGDWVLSPSVEGIVEDITFRSTRFRTFDQALVTVPNSTLANEAITNWSRMGKRRVSFYLGLNYATPVDKIEKITQRIGAMLKAHPEIHEENILVSFEYFQDSKLDILVQYYTKTTIRGEHLRIKEEINLQIMKYLQEEGVSLAFPSRSVYIESPISKAEGAGNLS
ncbi:Mechanosensitive ion channel MscS [Syntrophomonas zehnderi OL-4]|uniref:Mechanosensitive ion channel MscS n=2 Tax=Syntrophomonas TaxID=862 RepID=A0A0E4C7F5_9FIRM|nr:Mechanosensitive ion channel MscS [Syntrophomonas zehnderi OL-4]